MSIQLNINDVKLAVKSTDVPGILSGVLDYNISPNVSGQAVHRRDIMNWTYVKDKLTLTEPPKISTNHSYFNAVKATEHLDALAHEVALAAKSQGLAQESKGLLEMLAVAIKDAAKKALRHVL